MAARTKAFRPGASILSPSRKSMARRWLPSSPALNSFLGSEICAPLSKVSFTLPLWALATAMMPAFSQTGLPIHFHSSVMSGSASSMALRTAANVLPRQSAMPAISLSIFWDGVMGVPDGVPLLPVQRRLHGVDDVVPLAAQQFSVGA